MRVGIDFDNTIAAYDGLFARLAAERNLFADPPAAKRRLRNELRRRPDGESEWRRLQALAYGPMRPVGLRDPRTGRRPHALVQLRQDNLAGTLYNMVGFQTNLKWPEQRRIFRMIPGLEAAEFVRLGQMHRNTFINSPTLLRPTLQWHDRDDLFFAGQIIGSEGYVGSTAGGMLAGINMARLLSGLPPVVLPRTTMMGAIFHYVTHAEPADFQPMKANFGLLPPPEPYIRNKRARYQAYAQRALAALQDWLVAGTALNVNDH